MNLSLGKFLLSQSCALPHIFGVALSDRIALATVRGPYLAQKESLVRYTLCHRVSTYSYKLATVPQVRSEELPH